jgi:hypothetical protein
LLACVFAPLPARADAEAVRLNRKIQQLMLLDQILPVTFTKPQLRELIPVIEKARQAEHDLAQKELKLLRRSEAKMDAALANARKGRITTGPELKEITSMLQAVAATRSAMVREQSENVRRAMVQACNKGQVKAALKGFDPRWFDRRLDPEKMGDEERLRLYVRLVLLDPEAYPLLVELSR